MQYKPQAVPTAIEIVSLVLCFDTLEGQQEVRRADVQVLHSGAPRLQTHATRSDINVGEGPGEEGHANRFDGH